MGESTTIDGSKRIKEINEAREKINEEPFLGKDIEIREAIKYGVCTNLVLNDPEYMTLLLQLQKEEAERIRKEQEAEAERIRKAQEAEAERRRKEQEAKRAKEVNLEKNRMLFAIEWIETNKDYLESLNFKPELLSIYYETDKEDLHLNYTCEGAEGLTLALEIIFKRGEHILDGHNFRGGCYSGKQRGKIYSWGLSSSLKTHLWSYKRDLESIISEVNLYIDGIGYEGEEKHGIPELISPLYLSEPEYVENQELYENSILAENPFKYQIFRN